MQVSAKIVMMRSLVLFAALSILGLGGDSVNFDGLEPGVLPPNWSFTSAHGGVPSHWEVRPDPTAPSRGNVLEQKSGTAPADSPVAIFDKVICRDGELSVKFKIEAGRPAHAAGIVWRYQDPDNYYLLHFSADQKSIALFRIHNGKTEPVRMARSDGGRTAISHDVRAGQWYVAKVIFRGPHIRVLFGNRRLFDAEDSSIGGAGKTGVWTKGRTMASFDDFRIDRKS